jgi:hypothetical protein
MASDAATMLAAEGTVIDGGKLSPWLAVHVAMTKAMLGLSHRLRLSPQSRSPTNPKRLQAVSVYDRMRLESGNKTLPSVRTDWDGWKEK